MLVMVYYSNSDHNNNLVLFQQCQYNRVQAHLLLAGTADVWQGNISCENVSHAKFDGVRSICGTYTH